MLTESPTFVKWEGKNAPDHISLVNWRILLYLPRFSADVSLPAIIGYAVNWGLQRKGGIYRRGIYEKEKVLALGAGGIACNCSIL
jgi:hypothetical protein